SPLPSLLSTLPRPPPTPTLFPYTTLFRSRTRAHTQSCSSQIHPRTAPSQHPESTAQRAETSSARRMSPQPRSPAARQCSWCSWSLFFPFRCLFFGVFVSPLTYAYFPHAFILCLRFDPLLIPLR